jgi:hypothetical protein
VREIYLGFAVIGVLFGFAVHAVTVEKVYVLAVIVELNFGPSFGVAILLPPNLCAVWHSFLGWSGFGVRFGIFLKDQLLN